jgi:hypothetical protein
MLVWVPSVLFLTYPFILVFYTSRTIYRFLFKGHTSSATDDHEGCGAKIKATIGAVKKSVFVILREARAHYGHFVSCSNCGNPVDLTNILRLYKYEKLEKYDIQLEILYHEIDVDNS